MRRKYRAFISYSHADEVWGERLHRTLERYSPPRRLIGTEGRDGPVPKRLFPIFRDREELPTSSDLGGAIAAALEESDYLIVICSPRSAKSKWVGEEILTYKRLGRSDRILCLIVDGEPNATDIQGKEPIECFPEAIRFDIGDDGELTERRAEPVAADARDGGDGWRNAWMKLAAGLLGVDFDALRQRDRARRRLRGAAWAAAAACLIGAAGFGAMKEREARLAEQREASRAAALRVHAALDRGDEAGAVLALERAFRSVGALDPASEGATPEGLTALTRVALETRLLADYPAPAGEMVETMRLLPEGALAIVENGGRTHLMDPGTGEVTTVYRPDRFTHTRISEDGDTLWTARLEGERQDEDGSWFAPLLFEEAELATGEVRLATAVKSVPNYGGSAAISPDGALFAIDLGPGAGSETVIAAFRREAQELAGVIALPS
ncbi:MAG: toll/interleukin-1 receptor domain-containing protein, partial [Pseudomonadota bacterium]